MASIPNKMLVSHIKDGDFAVTGFLGGGTEPRTEIACIEAFLSTLLTWAVNAQPGATDCGMTDLLDHLRGTDSRIRSGTWEAVQEKERERINQERERINAEARLLMDEAMAYESAETS